jgi:hypothetical protein
LIERFIENDKLESYETRIIEIEVIFGTAGRGIMEEQGTQILRMVIRIGEEGAEAEHDMHNQKTSWRSTQ